MTANPYLDSNVDYLGIAGLNNFQSQRYHRKNQLNRNLSLDISDIFNTSAPLPQRMAAIQARQSQHLRDMSDDEAFANDAFEKHFGPQQGNGLAYSGAPAPSQPGFTPAGTGAGYTPAGTNPILTPAGFTPARTGPGYTPADVAAGRAWSQRQVENEDFLHPQIAQIRRSGPGMLNPVVPSMNGLHQGSRGAVPGTYADPTYMFGGRNQDSQAQKNLDDQESYRRHVYGIAS